MRLGLDLTAYDAGEDQTSSIEDDDMYSSTELVVSIYFGFVYI